MYLYYLLLVVVRLLLLLFLDHYPQDHGPRAPSLLVDHRDERALDADILAVVHMIIINLSITIIIIVVIIIIIISSSSMFM